MAIRAGTGAHQSHRQGQRRAAAGAVGVDAQDPAADRSYQEAQRIDAERVEKLDGRVGVGEEGFGEIQREEVVDVEVIPLDQVADRAAENGPQAMPHRRVIFGKGSRLKQGRFPRDAFWMYRCDGKSSLRQDA